MKKNLGKLIFTLCLLILQSSVYSGTGNLFNVSATGTPANLNLTLCLNAVAQISCQKYTATATTLNITTTIPFKYNPEAEIKSSTSGHVYPKAGIKINTPGYTASGCTQLNNGYCLFSASSTTPATITAQSGGNTTKSPRFAYTGSWDGHLISLCSVASDGTFNNCSGIPGPGPNNSPANQFSIYPGGVAVDPSNTHLYVADYSNGVFVCDINSTNGLLSNCTPTGTGYSSPEGITINPAGTIAYIGDYSGTTPIVICNVTPGTGALTSCTFTTYSTFAYPTNVVFKANGTQAWVGNYDITQVYLCNLNSTTGDLSACTLTPSAAPADLEYPTGIALNPAGTIMYVVSNDFSLVYKCTVNPDATLSACTTTGTGIPGWSGFVTPFGITLNAAGTYAYIANYDADNLISVCKVDAISGELTNCANTGSAFTSPFITALSY